MRALQPNARIYAAEPGNAAPLSVSMKAGRASRFEGWSRSWVDGAGGQTVIPTMWPLVSQWVDESIVVPLDDAASERLRETLLAFLECGSSYTAASARHALHKNSVKYRVERAVEQRGRPVGDDRIDLELALVACRWLGDVVLGDAGAAE